MKKGFVGLLLLGICIIIAAAIIVGAVTFPDAMSMIFGIIFWIIIAIVIITVTVIAGIIVLAAID